MQSGSCRLAFPLAAALGLSVPAASVPATSASADSGPAAPEPAAPEPAAPEPAASEPAPEPVEGPENSWVDLTGTVTSTTDTAFNLDYGSGIVTVEMDHWVNYGEAFPIGDGDQVTVYGEVDNEIYENAELEAASVYVDDLNSYFYASAAAKEELGHWAADAEAEAGDLTYIGEVETVNPATDTFTLETGLAEVTVDTSGMRYDPLDDEGFQKIEVGDRVSVKGVADAGFFDANELSAENVETLGKQAP